MTLSQHRPEPIDNLSSVTEWVKGRSLRELVPSQLEEVLLLSLAMELREIERMLKGGADVRDMSATLFLLTHMLFEFQKEKRQSDSVTLPVNEFAHAATILQLAIEREIVTRIVGVSDGNNDAGLLAAIEAIAAAELGSSRRQRQGRSHRN
jgi:predicted DNA-binding protein